MKTDKSIIIIVNKQEEEEEEVKLEGKQKIK